MARNQSFEMGFPPFRGAVRQLVIFSVAVYVALLLLRAFAGPLAQQIYTIGILTPDGIHHGAVWQFLTYGFMHDDPMNFVFAMLGVYFLGAAVEARIGSMQLYGLYLGSLVLAGVGGFMLSLSGTIAQGPAFGAGAAANAILMVFYMQNRGAPIMMFPLPISIPVSYIVIFTGAIETAYLLISHFALFFWVLLLGLAAGYIWYLAFLGRARSTGISERVYSLRNSYYRWKRRRAAKKFQVYMRKHDRNVYFDEYGNYKPPDDKGDEPGRGPWVN
jgi:membrane associated rhomboid family serine protease